MQSTVNKITLKLKILPLAGSLSSRKTKENVLSEQWTEKMWIYGLGDWETHHGYDTWVDFEEKGI